MYTNRFPVGLSRELQEKIQEALFRSSTKFKIDRTSIGHKLLVALLFTYKDLGRPGRIWNYVQTYIAELDDYDLTFQLGYLQREFGLLESCVRTFRSLLDRCILLDTPIEPALVAHLVEALNRDGRPDSAIDVVENAIDISALAGPTDSLHFNLGNSYLDVNRLTDAIRCYETALSMRQENTGHILHNLGECYYRLQEDEKALKYYRMALERADKSDVAFEERAVGDAYFAMDRHDEAKSYYRRAADHGDAEAEDRLADAEADLAQKEGA